MRARNNKVSPQPISTEIPGTKEQTQSLLGAMALWKSAVSNNKNIGINEMDIYLKDAFNRTTLMPLKVAMEDGASEEIKAKGVKAKYKDMQAPPSKQQIKDVEFIKRVFEMVDADENDNGVVAKTSMKDNLEKSISDNSTEAVLHDENHEKITSAIKNGDIVREQETAEMDYKILLKVASWYKDLRDGNDTGKPPLSLPLWKNEILGHRLLQLAAAKQKEDDLEGYFKSAKIQCPAKLRAACAGNMRRHTVAFETKSGAKVVVSSLPHASHASHDLKDRNQEVHFAKQSVASVMRSKFAQGQRQNLKDFLGLDGVEGQKILKEYMKMHGIDAKGVEEGKMLDKIMPQIITVDRLTSLVASHDLNASMVIDKAVSQIQADLKQKGDSRQIIATHHTIQSAFTIFAAIGTPFVRTQNQIAAEHINKQTKVAIDILRLKLADCIDQKALLESNNGDKELTQKQIDITKGFIVRGIYDSRSLPEDMPLKDRNMANQVQDKIAVLQGINANFNKGLNASNKAAVMYGGSFRISAGLLVAGVSALVAVAAVALFPAMPFVAAGIAMVTMAAAMKIVNDKLFATNKMSSSFKGLKGVSLLLAAAVVIAVTAPVSLPALGAVAVASVAGIAIGAGIIGGISAFVGSKYRDSSFIGKYRNSNTNHTWNAALQSLNVSLIGGIADKACHEGKDRTGTVLMMKTAYLTFMKLNDGKHPDINNKNDQKQLAQIFDVIILSGHDAHRTSYNCAGAASVKQLNHYIPAAIYAEMDNKTKENIKGYKTTTKLFDLKDTVARGETLSQESAEEVARKANIKEIVQGVEAELYGDPIQPPPTNYGYNSDDMKNGESIDYDVENGSVDSSKLDHEQQEQELTSTERNSNSVQNDQAETDKHKDDEGEGEHEGEGKGTSMSM